MIIFEENGNTVTPISSEPAVYQLLNWVPTPAGFLSAEGKILYLNPAGNRWFGNSLDQNGLNLEWCHPEDFVQVQEIVKGLKPVSLPIRINSTNGNTAWQWVKVFIIPFGSTPIPEKGMFFIEAINGDGPRIMLPLDNELLFQQLVEMAPIMIGIYMDGVIQYVNPTGMRLMGAQSRSDLIGRNIMDFIHPNFIPLIKERRQALSHQRVLPPVEEQIIRLDGRVIDVEVVTAILPVEGREAILAVGQDISRRKQAERALKESEERYFQLMRVSPNAVFILKRFAIQYLNPSAIKLLGATSEEELLGKKITQFLPILAQVFQKTEDRHWQGDSLETRLNPLRGDSIMVDVILTPVMLEGEVALQLIVRDISTRIAAEQSLKESRDRLRELSTYLQTVREKERAHIAREIHDELGQMLTALKLELALLMRRLPKNSGELTDSIKELSSMVDNTVKVVRRIASELRPEILDDLGLLAAIEWQAQEYQKRSGVHIYVQFEPEEFSVDRQRATTIFRIFQETLTNVMRHAQATEVFVTLSRKTGGLELVVEDNGKGIKATEMEKRGSLGIMGIKERARFWNGRVEIKSAPGEGTRVQVWIPEEKHG